MNDNDKQRLKKRLEYTGNYFQRISETQDFEDMNKIEMMVLEWYCNKIRKNLGCILLTIGWRHSKKIKK